ncbi:MAG: hypothetical protein JXA77_05945 [Bacteroidales bacterium]|nr:hypothetical protein [Bacteroidales bacterium]MBN2820580.1 hypothetical protein [Bacteroidales bacterium]
MVRVNDNEVVNYNFEQFIDEDSAQAFYYPEIKLMHFIWKNRCSSEDYRRLFTQALDFAENSDATLFLSDVRLQGIIAPDDRKWFESVAIPGAIERGLTKAAIVSEGNAFKMYYLNLLLKTFVKKDIPMKLFKDTQSGISWLTGG